MASVENPNRLVYPRTCRSIEIRNNGVVKSSAGTQASATEIEGSVVGLSPACARVARTLLEGGPSTAGEIAGSLQLTPTAVRRHLDTLIDRGYVEADDQAPFGPRRVVGQRGRGRPARFYTITAIGRDAFESAYDDVAVEALRFLRDRFGSEAVADFARVRARAVVARYSEAIEDAEGEERVQRLAQLLSADGFAATTDSGPMGWQIVQHHCPVAHVAEEFPQFCEAEREAFTDLLGVHITRLSTMAAGGGVCTSVIPTHLLLESIPRPSSTHSRGPSPDRRTERNLA
jgi:predicted ArsR family transcriptional regulator